MTLEDFAALIQTDLKRAATKDDVAELKKDIIDIRETMATKEDVLQIREEMATQEKLSDVADRISNVKDELQEQIAGLKYAKEIDELRSRVNVLESKLGIKSTHRAA